MPKFVTLGLVLAGGAARRMGGIDKARIRIGEATMLDRVLSRLGPQCGRVIISANGDPARFADTGLAVVTDAIPDHAGPLAGILAGLDWTACHATAFHWVVSAPSDCPFLPRDVVARLHQARGSAGALLACARSGSRSHPVVGLWPVALRDELRHALASEGMHKVDLFTARYRLGVAEWTTAPVDPFFNVNTPRDVAAAERIAAEYPDV